MLILKPLLHPPVVYKPRRLPLRKYVTITVGFVCPDGIVIGADSQESYEGSALKRSVPKLVSFPPLGEGVDSQDETPDRRVIFTGAGDSALVDKLIDEAWLEAASANPTIVDIATAIEKRIVEIYREYASVYHAGYMPSATITFGIWCASETRLFYAQGPVVNRIGKLDGTHFSGYKAFGVGNVITDYIQERMRANPKNIDDAIVLAAYMLEQAVAHGEGCGGDIRIAAIKNNGKARNIKIDRYTTLILKELDNQISRVVLQAATPQYSDKWLDVVWGAAKTKVFKLRADRKAAIEKEKRDQEELERAIEEMAREEERQKGN
jgi:hypothetical protein